VGFRWNRRNKVAFENSPNKPFKKKRNTDPGKYNTYTSLTLPRLIVKVFCVIFQKERNGKIIIGYTRVYNFRDYAGDERDDVKAEGNPKLGCW
jgi:hypothetical protein